MSRGPIPGPDDLVPCFWAWRRFAAPAQTEIEAPGAPAPALSLSSEAAALSPATPIAEIPVALFDLESTGLSPERDRIVEIFVRLLFPDGTTWERGRLVNPGVPIPPAATRVHGITDAEVSGAISFADLAPHLTKRIGGAVLVAHNAVKFDAPMLLAECRRAGLDWEPRAVIDTLPVSQRLIPKQKSYALQALRQGFGLGGGRAHRAGGDVDTLTALWSLLRRREPGATLADWGAK